MGSYTREWNIKWEHLSSDLQSMIYDIQNTIVDTQTIINANTESMTSINYNISQFYNKYEALLRKIEEETNKLYILISLKKISISNTDYDMSYLNESFKGEIVKMSKSLSNPIMISSLLYCGRISDNDDDKANLIESAITISDMMSSWSTLAHYDAEKCYELDILNNLRTNGLYFFKDHILIDIDSNTVHGYCQNDNAYTSEDIWNLKSNIDLGDGIQSHSISDILLDDSIKSRSSWVYNNDYVECTRTNLCMSSIYDTKSKTDNFKLTVRIDSKGESGVYGLLLGVINVGNIQHTLSIVRSRSSNTSIHWSLVYDLGYRDQFILNEDKNTLVGIDDSEGNNVFIRIVKSNNTLTCSTSSYSDETEYHFNGNWTIELSLPTEKPESWTSSMWYNIRQMLKRSRIGFLCRANKTKFYILDHKNILDYDDKIICLNEDKVYKLNSEGEYIENGSLSDHLEPRTYLYDDITKKLFYYEDNGEYMVIG